MPCRGVSMLEGTSTDERRLWTGVNGLKSLQGSASCNLGNTNARLGSSTWDGVMEFSIGH
jgi:hypothetical protein